MAERSRREAAEGRGSALKASPDEVAARVAALVEERRRLERELADAKKALAMGGGGQPRPRRPEQVGGYAFLGQVVDGLDPKDLRGLVDAMKQRLGLGRRRADRGQRRPRQRRRWASPTTWSGSVSAVDLVKAAVGGAWRAGRRRPARHGAGRRTGRREGE